MRRMFDSVSRGLLLISIGIVFLLINFGILSWGFWFSAVDLWPLLLILLGIGLLFSKRVPFSAVLLVFLLILVGYSMTFGERSTPFWYGPGRYIPFYSSAQSGGQFPVDVKLPNGVTKAQVNMNLGGAKVDIHPLSGDDKAKQLVQGSYQWESAFVSDKPTLNVRQSGDTMQVMLSSGRRPGIKDNLDLGLSNRVKYSFKIDAGAVDGNLDFSEIPVEDLTLNTGASKFRLVFGDTGTTLNAKVSSGASDITLAVPENVGLRVHMSGVVSNTDFMGTGLFLDNKDWVSSGYDQARSKVSLDVSMAAGSVHLERPQIATH
ncbi:MAG: LiaI-LiaF-like domain-containing protein [Desulfitobacteriaceae bacterium]